MKLNGNGRRQRVLDNGPVVEGQAGPDLFEEYKLALLRGTKSEAERELIQECLVGFEARPPMARLVDAVSRRVTDPDDKFIVDKGGKFLRRLPEEASEPRPDPVIEKEILDAAARKAAAQAAADATQGLWIAGKVALMKADPAAAGTAALRVRVAALHQDYQDARDRLDRESGRLQQLLTLRADRKRQLMLAESLKK
jgi:hypothetical protein